MTDFFVSEMDEQQREILFSESQGVNVESQGVNVSLVDAIYRAQRDIQENPSLWDKSTFHYFEYVKRMGFGSELEQLRRDGAISGYNIVNFDVVASRLESKGLKFVTPSGVQSRGYGGGGGGPTRDQQIENMMANMRAAALAWNIRIDDPNLRNLAATAVDGNYNNQQVMNSIGRWSIAQDAGTTSLADGPLGQAMNDLAKNYGVQVSKSTIDRYLQGFVQGTETQESITAMLQKQATNMYPALAERFAAGETFTDITSQYREIAARLLEKEAGSFDFIGSNLNKAFTYNPDGKQERIMSMGEFTNYLRQNREFGYEYTNDAKNKAYGTVRALTDLFGRA